MNIHGKFNCVLKRTNAALKGALSVFCAALLALLVLDVLFGVLTRYIMGSQAAFTEECARMLLVWLTFFGGAYAFARKAHIGLDYLVLKFSPEPLRGARCVAAFLSIVFALSVLLAGGTMFVYTACGSQTTLVCMPFVKLWCVYLCVPLSGVLIFFFALETFLDALANEPETPNMPEGENL